METEQEATTVINTSNDNAESKKRSKRVVDYAATLFEIEPDTISAVLARIRDNHEQTGTGISASDLAEEFCDDEKYAPLLAFTVEKYLNDTVEIVPGVGCCIRGMKRVEGARKAPPIQLDQDYVDQVEKFVVTLLNKVKNLSVNTLVLQAAIAGKLDLDDKNSPNDTRFRIALDQLCSGENAKFVNGRGSGFRRANLKNPASTPAVSSN